MAHFLTVGIQQWGCAAGLIPRLRGSSWSYWRPAVCLLGLAMLFLATACSAPLFTSPAAREDDETGLARGRRTAVRRHTGRLREEDLGLLGSEAGVGPDSIQVPPGLSRSHPETAAALRLTEQARKLLTQGDDLPRAIVLLEQAVGLASQVPYAYYFLGEAHFRLGSSDRALAFLEWASELLGDDAYWASRVWALRGLVWESRGEQVKALDAYEHAAELWPDNLTAVSGCARLRGYLRE